MMIRLIRDLIVGFWMITKRPLVLGVWLIWLSVCLSLSYIILTQSIQLVNFTNSVWSKEISVQVLMEREWKRIAGGFYEQQSK